MRQLALNRLALVAIQRHAALHLINDNTVEAQALYAHVSR